MSYSLNNHMENRFTDVQMFSGDYMVLETMHFISFSNNAVVTFKYKGFQVNMGIHFYEHKYDFERNPSFSVDSRIESGVVFLDFTDFASPYGVWSSSPQKLGSIEGDELYISAKVSSQPITEHDNIGQEPFSREVTLTFYKYVGPDYAV